MRIFIAGQKAFGAEVFRLCQGLGQEIVGVSSPAWSESNVSGTDAKRRDRLRVLAEDAGVRWMVAGSLKADTIPPGIDLILAAHSHDFISKKTRLKTNLGAIGYHPSLLPLHRGRDAVRWTIKMRDRVAGGSIYWLSENMDGGDIAAQDFCFVRPRDTAETLWRRELFPIGVRLFERVLTELESGILTAIPQDGRVATWEPSWERPPAHRPDLLMLGGGLDGYTVVRKRAYEPETPSCDP